jgi:hypothetical protein
MISLAVLSYIVPIFRFRKFPDALFWWMWIVGAVGLVVALDLHRESALTTIPRYTILSAPAIYAILAMPLPTKVGKFIPASIVLGTVVSAIGYQQRGQFPPPVLRETADSLRHDVEPGDAVILTGRFYDFLDWEPAVDYFVLEHYGMNWNTPVVFATGRIGADAERELKKFRRVWVVGVRPQEDTDRMLPGWRTHDIRSRYDDNAIWRVTPQ